MTQSPRNTALLSGQIKTYLQATRGEFGSLKDEELMRPHKCPKADDILIKFPQRVTL